MVRNIVVLGGNSHPELVERVCSILGVPPCNRILSKFEVGESRCEIQDSVRGKDVYIIQSGGGKVNDHFMDLCIMISACKTGSAKRVTAVLPLFPYSRQPDLPYNKAGAPLSKASGDKTRNDYTFESVPPTPSPSIPRTAGLTNTTEMTRLMSQTSLSNGHGSSPYFANGDKQHARKGGAAGVNVNGTYNRPTTSSRQGNFTTHDYENPTVVKSSFHAKPGYKQWVATAGTLVADLLMCAGADHIITMDLHDPQYQGFFDVPVDNLYGKPLIKQFIQQNMRIFRDSIIVSPDAGGAKRATAIADDFGMEFALIHKERRPTKISDGQNATMMLVGDVAGRVCILVDDLADTANTITRAAKLLKKEGASAVYSLLTHGVLSGDAINRINASALDRVVVTNTVRQDEHLAKCPRLQVLDVSEIFAEAIRRVHHGESISTLFRNH